MDFSKVSSLSGYVKNIKLEIKWNRKKETNDFQSQSKKSELQRKNEMFKASYMQQRENNKEDETLNTINNKIAAGTDLTPNEMKYLKNKNPIMYQKLMAAETEKKNYEKELKKCQTKEEVEKLKMSKVSSAISSINAVKNNPNIPESTKLSVAQSEMKRLQDLEKVADKFEKSSQYSKLPTDAEKLKAESDISEAECNETKKLFKDEKTTEIENKSDNIEEKGSEFKLEVNNLDAEMTKIEAELTPEAQKLKRSKVKAIYEQAERDFTPVMLQKTEE